MKELQNRQTHHFSDDVGEKNERWVKDANEKCQSGEIFNPPATKTSHLSKRILFMGALEFQFRLTWW